MVGPLELRGWHVAEGFEKTVVVVPVDPFEDSELDFFGIAPRATPADDLSREQADDGLCERVVVGVTGVNRERGENMGSRLGGLSRSRSLTLSAPLYTPEDAHAEAGHHDVCPT